MKNLRKILMIIAIAIFAFACKDDPNNPDNPNNPVDTGGGGENWYSFGEFDYSNTKDGPYDDEQGAVGGYSIVCTPLKPNFARIEVKVVASTYEEQYTRKMLDTLQETKYNSIKELENAIRTIKYADYWDDEYTLIPHIIYVATGRSIQMENYRVEIHYTYDYYDRSGDYTMYKKTMIY